MTTDHNASSNANGPAEISNTNNQNIDNQNLSSNANGPTYSELGIVTDRPKRFEYALKIKRLETFSNWPREHHIQPSELVEAGFYYAGYGDCTRCFYCGGGLRNWQDDDDDRVEHARWFSKAPFIRQRLGQIFVDTVQELNKTLDKIPYNAVINKIGPFANGPTYSELGIVTDRPKHPEYANRSERLKTFSNWPREHHIQPTELADTGFYYAGYSDCVICHFCSVMLRGWGPSDDVFVEHVRRSTKCSFMRLKLGQSFVDKVVELGNTYGKITYTSVTDTLGPLSHALCRDGDQILKRHPSVKAMLEYGYNEREVLLIANMLQNKEELITVESLLKNLDTKHAMLLSTTSAEDENMRLLQKENAQLRKMLQCKVCQKKNVEVVFLPCRHFVTWLTVPVK
ncbi:Baculoviral IAP repeat-containing protein 2 [Bulinus truncatus]|nr:Baculoviral IAP repeat-containing protein 2 [Bulinus truncatus]